MSHCTLRFLYPGSYGHTPVPPITSALLNVIYLNALSKYDLTPRDEMFYAYVVS